LEFQYEHDTRSVFADFDAMRAINPLGRIPSLARIIHEGQGLRSADVREGGAWGAIGGVG
jgi:hypothetical protein